ncbi:hypothetical protein V7138_17430 [Bacillus sp. JJ1533]|uniref:hypothetical protein n=1 Tax=Bacillus sp. JJ1533 TaxID=3122959 RepID=UPI002FFE732D
MDYQLENGFQYKMVVNKVPTRQEFFQFPREISLRVKIGKKVYLFNYQKIINTIENSLSYSEKIELFNALTRINERNNDFSNYLKTILTGIITREEYSVSIKE